MGSRLLRFVLLGIFLVSLAGCSLVNGDSPSSDPANAGRDYYYDDFPDVPIPIDMSPESDRFTALGQGGLKLGIEEFSGRVDHTSLVNAMQNYMLRDGWTLRSLFRAKRSILVFEKPDRICSLYITDGVFSTSMLVFVSPKLAPGDVTYRAPAVTTTPADTSSGVQNYPAGGFSSTTGQPLSQ